MRPLALGLALGWGLVACASHPPAVMPPVAPPSPPAGGHATPAELAATIAADAERSDQATDAKAREALASAAEHDAEACLSQAPGNVACLYGHAVALGLDARAHPTHAVPLLGQMLDALKRAESVDPDYDEAGPERVRALVLLRAPGWPLGPGDPDAALAAAQSAVARRPDYPPNRLALAEALAKTGDAAGARANYTQALDAARAAPPSATREGWLREAEQGLAHP